MECYCHVLASVPNCYLDMFQKLQKRLHRTIPHALVVSLEPIAHCRNMGSISLFCEYYFYKCSSDMAVRFHFFILVGGSIVILMGCKFFLPPFLDVKKMSMSTLAFLTYLDFGIYRLKNVFH